MWKINWTFRGYHLHNPDTRESLGYFSSLTAAQQKAMENDLVLIAEGGDRALEFEDTGLLIDNPYDALQIARRARVTTREVRLDNCVEIK